MSSELEPIPGDLVAALHEMRAWETEARRGSRGALIAVGEQAFVVASWDVGRQRRLRVLRDHRIMVFSCADHVVLRNWRIVRAAPRLPTLGCP